MDTKRAEDNFIHEWVNKNIPNNLWLNLDTDNLVAFVAYLDSEDVRGDLQKYNKIVITIKYSNRDKIFREYEIDKNINLEGFKNDIISLTMLLTN